MKKKQLLSIFIDRKQCSSNVTCTKYVLHKVIFVLLKFGVAVKFYFQFIFTMQTCRIVRKPQIVAGMYLIHKQP